MPAITEVRVQRNDYRKTSVWRGQAPALQDGEILVSIDKFALTANNVTYAVFGDMIGYWRFYPTAGDYGIVPAWGYATVVVLRAVFRPSTRVTADTIYAALSGYLLIGILWTWVLTGTLDFKEGGILAGNVPEELTGPLLVQFMANLLLLYDPIRKLNKVNLMLQQALAAGHRLADLLALPNEIQDRPHASVIHGVEREVAFEGVGFGYVNVPVLHDVNLAEFDDNLNSVGLRKRSGEARPGLAA